MLIGFWAIGYAGRSITLLVVWVGATALGRGISSLFIAFGLHDAGRQLRSRMTGSSAPAADRSAGQPSDRQRASSASTASSALKSNS